MYVWRCVFFFFLDEDVAVSVVVVVMMVVSQLVVVHAPPSTEADPAAARAERERARRGAAHGDADDGAHAQDEVAAGVMVARARARVPPSRALLGRSDALALDHHALVAAALVAVLSAPSAVAEAA